MNMAFAREQYTGFQSNGKYMDATSRRIVLGGKKPRHTPETRKEATRRERIRVKALAQAYVALQHVIPFDSGTKITYLTILKGAVAYIKALEMLLGIREDILNCKSRKRTRCVISRDENNENEQFGKRIKEEPA